MIKTHCSACNFEYVVDAGHCCSDSETTTHLRIKLAEEIYKNKDFQEAKEFIISLQSLLTAQNKRLLEAARERDLLLSKGSK